MNKIMNLKIDKFFTILTIIIILALISVFLFSLFNTNYFKNIRIKKAYNRGVTYYNIENYVSAEKEFNKAISIKGDSYYRYRSYEKLVPTLRHLGKYKQANELNKSLPILQVFSLPPLPRDITSDSISKIKIGKNKSIMLFSLLSIVGFLFMLFLRKAFLEYLIPPNVFFFLAPVLIVQILAIFYLNTSSARIREIIFFTRTLILILFFIKFLNFKFHQAFIMTVGYSFIVDVLPALISMAV